MVAFVRYNIIIDVAMTDVVDALVLYCVKAVES